MSLDYTCDVIFVLNYVCILNYLQHNKKRLNEYLEDEMVEEQCCFRKGRSCTDAVFTVQQLMEKRKEHNLPLFLLFIDYEKAYDNVNRAKL